MSNSPLVSYTKISPNSSNPRNAKIDTITIHHMAGNLTVEQLGAIWANKSRNASSNYGIDNKGRVGMYVEEKNRSWCSSNRENDNRAITIEVANIGGAPDWKVGGVALAKLIDLCADICIRNGIQKLNFTGDKTGNLTMHKWFAATACPGAYLESKFPYIAAEVNKRLAPVPADTYKVKSGDSLWSIAVSQLGDGNRWSEIQALNAIKNPNVITVGQVLKIPTEKPIDGVRDYTVVKNDSPWSIAAKQLGDGTRYREIEKLNGLSGSYSIYAGQVLQIPTK
jgi:LysM repeat protein